MSQTVSDHLLNGLYVVRTDILCAVAPPAGPVVERYNGVAWPGGRF